MKLESLSPLLLVAWAASSCGEEPRALGAELAPAVARTMRQEVRSTDKVLILGTSVNGGINSPEAQAVRDFWPLVPGRGPVTIDVKDATQWAAMTPDQFMSYYAIIIGDANCTSGTAAFQAAINNKDTWSQIIDGDVVILGTNPSSGSKPQLMRNGIEQVIRNSEQYRTGLYISLGCAYQNAPTNTPVPLLSWLGDFKVTGSASNCAAAAGHMFEMRPVFTSHFVNDAYLGNGGCAARSVFTTYPFKNFAVAAIGLDATGSQPYNDYTENPDIGTPYFGTPYILVRGATSLGSGCGGNPDNVPSGEECDLGDMGNGVPGNENRPASETCSFSCRINWCGDGVVDSVFGEECDNGVYNGRTPDSNGSVVNGMCSKSCKIVSLPVTSNPPVARCTNVTVSAPSNACGAPANINNGSIDPDGDLDSCTQSPAGPYNLGNTTVTLTCRDLAGNTATCTGIVTVRDVTPPTVTVGTPDRTVQCSSSASYTDPSDITASDLCSNPVTMLPPTGSVSMGTPGIYTLTYSAKDAAMPTPNTGSATRTVTVVDTTAPSITLSLPTTISLECGSAYTEPGWTTTDSCYGPLNSSVVVTGTVNSNVPGQQQLRYNLTDPSGNAATQRIRTINVSDTLRPNVTILGDLNQTVQCNDPAYADPGATASDQCDGALPAVAIPPPNPGAVGTQTITYRATDRAGNVGTSATGRSVTVQDSLPPTLTMQGANPQSLECGTAWADPGATANDQCAGPLAVTRLGGVNHGVPAAYTVTYSASDGHTPTISQTRTVLVRDTLAPNITVQGPLNDSFQCGSTYVDPGATANDACAGNVPVTSTRTGNPGQPGTFTISYSATDPSGNSVTSPVTRTVTVDDDTPPTLMLLGSVTPSVECGTSWTDPGATANDLCFGDLTGAITRTGSVSTGIVGPYTLTYDVTDGAGLSATPVTRTVNVGDTQAPTITVLGPLNQSVQCNRTPYADPGATAADLCAGNLTAAIVRTGSVNTGAAGTYTLSYRVSDLSGNQTTAAESRTVTVVDDQPPTISLTGPATGTHECGSPYNDPGATASDACAGDLTASITRSGNVNSGAPGDYPVIYNVTDAAGNSAPSVNRTVQVRDTTLPVITVLGSASDTYECGATYTDPGATALDSCAGNLTSAIVDTRVSDPGAPANFTITYSVSDSSGNTAVASASRTVTMNDSTPPSISLIGPANQVLECSRSPYSDPGATATDACVGPVPVDRTGSVNMGVRGNYTLSYSARDTAGNISPTLTRNVTVNDTTPPAITLIGDNAVRLECNVDTYTDEGATADDICSGPAAVTVDASAVNPQVPGPYLVRYTASDASGNINSTVRNVLVEDGLPPTISLNGANPMVMECATPFRDPGATAADICQGILPASAITATPATLPNVPGEYDVTYSARDPAGNTTVSGATRRFKVVDMTAPVLDVHGPPEQQIECGSRYVEPGASAEDSCEGDLSDAIQVRGSLKTGVVGSYVLTYEVADSSNNRTSSIRQVTVVDTQSPSIMCPEPITVGASEGPWATVTLGVAEATDACSQVEVSSPTQTRFPVGTTEVTYTATDAAGNTSSCSSTVTVTLDRALLGNGNGCSSTGSGPSSLAVMGLGLLAALLARNRTRPGLLAVGVLLLSGRASAQPEGIPSFELELLKLNPSGTGSLLLGTGELLPDDEYRLSLTTHYENDPLVLFLNGEKKGVVVRHRATAHLAAAYGLWGWVELGVQVPVLLFQGGDDLTGLGVGRPEGGLTPGTPLFTLRVKLLAQREEDPVDLSLGVHAGPSVGSGAALAREPRATPSLMAGRRFGPLRAAIDAGILLRPRTILSTDDNIQDELGHALRLGGTLATLGEGLRGELAVITLMSLKREGSSIEALAGARWPVSASFEAYGLAGLAFGNAPGTPDFRVLLGVAYGRARLAPAASIQQEPVPVPLDLQDLPEQDGEAVQEKDSDNDDILDESDACPFEAGIAEMRGCPARDRDQDTVQDHLDNCPEVAGPVENQGCPAEEKQLVAIQKDRIEIKETVHFDFDRATIQSRSFPLLDQVARILTEHPEILSVTIEGHTDERGSAEYNRDLSQRRAEAVRDYLAGKEVARERMEAQGFGEDRPVQTNATDEGRAANRRVEFITSYEQKRP